MPKPARKFNNRLATIGRYRQFLFAVIFLAVLLGGYFLLLQPLLDSYRQNLILASKLKGDIDSAQVFLAVAGANGSQATVFSDDEKKLINLALPDQLDHSALVSQLSSLASTSGFKVASIDINENVSSENQTKTTSSNIGRVNVNLKLNGGDYQALRNFIDLAEHSVMLMDINSLNFSAKPPYQVSLAVYYFKSYGQK